MPKTTTPLPFHRLQLKALQDVRAASQLMDSQPDVAVAAEVVAVGLPHRVRAVDLEAVEDLQGRHPSRDQCWNNLLWLTMK